MQRSIIVFMLCLSLVACGQANTTASTTTNGGITPGPLFVGVTFQTLQPTVFTAWEGKAGHRIHRVHRFFDFNVITPNSNTLNAFASSSSAIYQAAILL